MHANTCPLKSRRRISRFTGGDCFGRPRFFASPSAVGTGDESAFKVGAKYTLAATGTTVAGIFEDMRRRVPDLRKIDRYVGYQPQISLNLLLEMTVRDMCDQMGIACPVGLQTT